MGVKRDVNSKPEASLYALRGLLSVRYTLVPKEKVEDWEKEKLEGWNLVSSTTSYLIYENENWVPMGFTYDSYITEEDFETVSDTHAGNVLMKALLLTDEQVERYGQMMQNLTDDEKNNIPVPGAPADDETAPTGLMAGAAPAGHSETVLTYHTAGLRQSVAVSAGAIVVYAVWVAVLHRKKRREESSVG